MKENAVGRLATEMLMIGTAWLLATWPGTARGADYIGASAVLQAVEARHAKPDESGKTNESTRLSAELKEFSHAAESLPATVAAKRWLELADRWVKVQSQARAAGGMYYQDSLHDELLEALPPPATWGELARAIAARPPAKGDGEIREIGLSFLGATLTNDTNALNQVIARLSAKARGADPQESGVYVSFLQQIGQTLQQESDDPDAVLRLLNNQVDSARPMNPQQINVPNLADAVGPEKTGVFLKRALLNPNVTLQFNGAGATSRLAQKLALELISQLPAPHWELINSLDTVALYEAMDKQFPDPTNNPASGAPMTIPGMPPIPNLPDLTDRFGNSEKASAQIYYLLGLISKDRTADAVVIAKKITGRNNDYMYDAAFKEMERAGYTEALDGFFHDLLAQNPELPFWHEYVEVAAHAGKTERMVALVRSALNQQDLSDGQKAALQQTLFTALLAADNVDEAVGEIRQLAARESPPGPGQHFNPGQLGVILARVGVLVQKPEWAQAGIDIARKWLGQQAGAGNEDVAGALAQILTGLHRGPEAEAVLTDALAAATVGGPNEDQYVPVSGAAAILTDLAVLYHQAGRYNDVLQLLNQSPDWGAGDLSDILSDTPEEFKVPVMFLHTGSSPLPISYLAANALLATGQKDAAQKILAPLQDHFPGLDRCYELLIALEGTNAIPQLDAWFKRDQFEERPLIWKAHLLRQENRLEEAEKTVRQAIAIDPSDGEEGRGDRMRAYAELSEIRAARGDQKEADFYAEVVKAIRLSEDADQFYQAGLLKRAIPMYKEGLEHFADAYCIQTRLAIQLSELGLNAEAEEHYRRAYELMPDSFGRVESHCFGCEKAFDGERAQSLAEQVFTKFVAEHPDKPQIHYLLGYLRGEQERFAEARTNYLEAVRLDPDYLNAWVKLQEVSRQVLVPARERDEIAFNILRLDPLNRHTSPNFGNIHDLAGLWNVAAAAAAKRLAPAQDLLPLSASKNALAKKTGDSRSTEMMVRMQQYARDNSEHLTPASAVAQTTFVRLAAAMIMNTSGLEE